MATEDSLSGILSVINQNAPKICVDYLSHEWSQEDDIWASWKVMSKKKKELSNGIRLENASWRTWAKQKYNLKTVNPNKLNWMKDSDVTWLYGPLHTAWSSSAETSSKSSNTEDKLNLLSPTTSSSTTTIKSCLKKKSISELLRLIIKGRYGPPLVSSNSDTQLYKREKETDDLYSSDCETASTCSSMSIPSTPTTGPIRSIMIPVEKSVSHNRRIQFNDRVEQCIAIESDNDNSDDSSDDGIIMKSSPKKKKDFTTICKLAPTKLKEDRVCNNEYSLLYSNSRRRSSLKNNSSSSSNSSTKSSTSSSSIHQPWMDDDEDYDLDDDFVDLIDFDLKTPSSPSSYYQVHDKIIPPSDENGDDDDDDFDDEDDILIRAVNIAYSVREFMRRLF